MADAFELRRRIRLMIDEADKCVEERAEDRRVLMAKREYFESLAQQLMDVVVRPRMVKYDNRLFWFCDTSCKERFEVAPERYLDASKATPVARNSAEQG
jgi:hypothetical protein